MTARSCGPDDAQSIRHPIWETSALAFPTLTMSVRPTLLDIPDELFVKILSSLDFLQLIRSQSVRYFRYSSAIWTQPLAGLQTFRPCG